MIGDLGPIAAALLSCFQYDRTAAATVLRFENQSALRGSDVRELRLSPHAVPCELRFAHSHRGRTKRRAMASLE